MLEYSHFNIKMTSGNERVLICGITGQDGGFLAKHFLAKGYEVFGTSRSKNIHWSGLDRLGIREKVTILSLDIRNKFDVARIIEGVSPTLVYNVGGMTSVSDSFNDPQEAFASISIGTVNWLEAIRVFNNRIRYFNAGSSECFGNVSEGKPANEFTPFDPLSPYAAAKASAKNIVDIYRKSYGMFCCTGITSNHESSLRSDRFVTQKIINGVRDISSGKRDFLDLGNTDIRRDWGWAPEYIEAMALMMEQASPNDYVIATGNSISLKEFISVAFEARGLDSRDHVRFKENMLRPNELVNSELDAGLIQESLGWRACHSIEQIVEKMLSGSLY